MSARVLVVGLDAAEATLLERWAGEGRLPALAELGRRGAVARLANSLETLPGAIWPEITTGVSGGRLGLYYHPGQIHTGEAVSRRVTPDQVTPAATSGRWPAGPAAGWRWSTSPRWCPPPT